MSYSYHFAPSDGILRCTFEGRVDDNLIEEYYRTAPVWVSRTHPRAAITDFSAVSSLDVSTDMIAKLARSAPILQNEATPRIIVASSAHMFGLARMFQIMGEATRAGLRVVRTLQEAYAALGVNEPRFEPVSDSDAASPPSECEC